jgi:hypothetical protein
MVGACSEQELVVAACSGGGVVEEADVDVDVVDDHMSTDCRGWVFPVKGNLNTLGT